MSTSRAKRSTARFKPSCEPGVIVDHGFVPVRAKLLEVAAFLDRVDRYEADEDFRCAALREAAAVLVDGRSERVRRILEKLSDPTEEPAAESSGKAALGAWQRPAGTPAPVRQRRKK